MLVAEIIIAILLVVSVLLYANETSRTFINTRVSKVKLLGTNSQIEEDELVSKLLEEEYKFFDKVILSPENFKEPFNRFMWNRIENTLLNSYIPYKQSTVGYTQAQVDLMRSYVAHTMLSAITGHLLPNKVEEPVVS